jgi:hypothetical protein
VGLGECRRTGGLVCTADGTATACDVQPGAPAVEVCNGRDDDCDGNVDEDFDLGAPCTAGAGACAVDGHRVCGADGAAACDAVPHAPQVERCNTVDDDCDGHVDEDFPNLGRACDDPADADVCARGLFQCGADGRVACAGDVPSPERCNYRDDDCDGTPDNGFDLFTDADNCGACGVVCPAPYGSCRDATCYRDYWVSASTGSDALGDGSRAHPWRTISHAAATVVGPLATINVLPGRYASDMDPVEFETFPVRAREGVPILGAGPADEVVVDGGHQGTVFLFDTLARDDNGLSGLTVLNGGRAGRDGAAVRVFNSHASVSDVVVTGAQGASSAAAIEANGGQVIIDRCTVTGSQGTNGAGIIVLSAGSGSALLRSHLQGNGVDRAGVVQVRLGRARVENTTVDANTGAGISAEYLQGEADVVHCSVVDNTGSGVLLLEGATARIANDILAYNGGWGIQEGHVSADPVNGEVVNNLIEGNTQGAYQNEGTTTFTPAERLGDGNYSGDPRFVSRQAGNLRLRADSAAIDRADAARSLADDQDGNPRPQGAAPDVGAFEFVAPP